MPLALPLLIPFAEIAGIAIGAVTTAVGLKALSDKVEDYIEDNPENAQKIFAIIEPEQGLASIFNTEADDGEEISETEEVVEVKPKKLTGKEKGMRMRQAALQRKGNYSSPDAEGNYESKRGRMIRTAEELGLADPDLKDNYKKSNFDYKKYFRKADGGMMEYANGGGVGSMMEPKKKVPQLVTPSKDGSRPGYRGPGGYQGGSSSGGSKSSSGGSKGTGGSSGNQGGGGGGQNTISRRYSPPTRPTYTSKTIDNKTVTGNDYRDSRNDFINNLNKNNQITAAQNNTRFTPYSGGARTSSYYNPNPFGDLLRLAATFAIPGGNFLLNKGGKFKEGIMSLNDSIQNSDFGRSTSFADYKNIKSFGGYNEREMAKQINRDEAKNLQARIDGGEFGGFENSIGLQNQPSTKSFYENEMSIPNTQSQGLSMMEDYYNSIDNKATGPNIVQDASEIAQQAKVFDLQDLQGIGALEKGKVFGYNTTDQGDALEKFRENATSMNQGDFYKGANVQSLFDQLLQNENKNATQNQGYLQNVINQGFLENQTDFTKQKSLEDFT